MALVNQFMRSFLHIYSHRPSLDAMYNRQTVHVTIYAFHLSPCVMLTVCHFDLRYRHDFHIEMGNYGDGSLHLILEMTISHAP
jgi:hypothetical protein